MIPAFCACFAPSDMEGANLSFDLQAFYSAHYVTKERTEYRFI